MSVTAQSSDSSSLVLGDLWILSARVTDIDGNPVAVAPVVTVTSPAGSTSTPTATLQSDGSWRASVTLATAGRWLATVVSTGNGAANFTTYAAAPTSPTAFPVLADLDTYLGANNFPDPALQDALDAEGQAQRDVCRIPAAYPYSLREALLRRCARNLALRALPLAVLRGDAEGGDSTVLPGRDPEVRRLEGPYRKLPVG